jgi:gp32 DNA binding protein like
MAISFANTKGTAIKGAEAYKYKDDENTVRLVGDVLPRYVYWLKGTNGKDIPVECLAFNRDKEKFDNKETDLVQQYFPEVKCGWAYAINCIDPSDGKVKVLNLKKKLFQQIMDAAGDGLGDPTDPDTGWDVVFKKKKTGALAFNVEYTLSVLKLKKRALTEEERAAVAAAETIDVKLPRPTVAEVRALLEKIKKGDSEEEPVDNATAEAAQDLQ